MALSYVTYRVALTFTEPALGTVPMNPDLYRDYIESKKPEEEQEEEHKTVEAREERGWTGFHREPDSYELPADPKKPYGPAATVGGTVATTLDRKMARSTEKNEPIVFKRGHLFTYDYTVRGFLKESLNALRQIDAHDVRGVKTKIDQFVFAWPRRIPFLEAESHLAGPVSRGGCGHEGVLDKDRSLSTRSCSLVHKAHDVLERPLRADTPMGPRVALARSDLLKPGTRLEFEVRVLAPKVFPEEMLRLALERGELIGWGQWRSGSYGRFTFTLEQVGEAVRAAKIVTAPAPMGAPKGRGRPKKDAPASSPSAAPEPAEVVE